MLWTGLALLILASALLALAIRGRVVARGRFCRRCKFDLAGLDAPNCPECGRNLTAFNATRARLRGLSKPLLVLALAVCLPGIVLIVLGTTNAAFNFYARLPDRAVFLLADNGFDGALNEVGTRLTRTPPVSPETWGHMINRTLDRQADERQPWDPRWGDLLAEALAQDHMTDEQVRRYILEGLPLMLHIHREIPIGRSSASFLLATSAQRAYAGPHTKYRLGPLFHMTLEVSDQGRVSTDHISRPGGRTSHGLYLPDKPDGRVLGMISAVPLRAEDWQGVSVGDAMPVFFEYTLTLRRESDAREWVFGSLRVEQPLRVVAADEPLVKVRSHQNDAADTVALSRSSALRIDMNNFRRLEGSSPVPVYHGLQLVPSNLPIAGRVFIRSDGVETEIGTIISGDNLPYSGMGRWIQNEAYDAMIALLESCIARGHADLVFRTDPVAAEPIPTVRSVLRVDMLFPRVPVLIPDPDSGDWPDDETAVPAQPLTPAP